VGAAGRADTVGAGGADAAGRGADTVGGAALVETGGATGGGTAGRAIGVDAATGAAAGGGAGGAGAVKVGLGVAVGTTNLGGATGGAAGALGAGMVAAGGAVWTAGLVSTCGGATTGGTVATAGPCCLLMIALRASPGLEILERSILVLISSPSARTDRAGRLEVCAALAERRRARTLSASWSSRELEWLFFSVTPTSGSTSRIDLLLTSSSLARSLIRILLIRPFALRTVPLSLHINLTASVFRIAQPLRSARKNRTLLLLLGRSRLLRGFGSFFLPVIFFASSVRRRRFGSSLRARFSNRFQLGCVISTCR
jgi:hypothetical protein